MLVLSCNLNESDAYTNTNEENIKNDKNLSFESVSKVCNKEGSEWFNNGGSYQPKELGITVVNDCFIRYAIEHQNISFCVGVKNKYNYRYEGKRTKEQLDSADQEVREKNCIKPVQQLIESESQALNKGVIKKVITFPTEAEISACNNAPKKEQESTNKWEKDKCFLKILNNHHNKEICNLMSDTVLGFYCKAAFDYGESCPKWKEFDDTQINCLEFVAFETGNVVICDKVLDVNEGYKYKQRCVNIVNGVSKFQLLEH